MNNTNTTARWNLDTCSVLVEFNASVWTARKLDKGATDEIVASKNAGSKDAARVNKHLLAGRNELDIIQQLVGRARTYVYDNTLPWSDSGMRILPTIKLESFSLRMEAFADEFEMGIAKFIDIYPTLITAQAMALGDMFKRDDYPTQGDMSRRFAFRVNYMPMPSAGDFRVDVGNAALADLKGKLEQITQERVEAAQAEFRERIATHLRRMSDRLTTDVVEGKEKGRRFHDSLVDGALELCDLAKSLNITNDPSIEGARSELEQLLCGVTPTELRKNDAVREDVKKNVDAILDKFNW